MSVPKHLQEHAKLGIYGRSNTTLTVGASGQFKTIQAAIDYIETQDAFIDITGDFLAAGAVTTWAYADDTWTPSSVVTPTAGAGFSILPVQKMWFRLESDTEYYPVEEFVGAGIGAAALEHCKTIRRIGATVSTPQAISWYLQNDFTIALDDAYYNEILAINSNVNITFAGTGNNVLQFFITASASFVSGSLNFRNIIVGPRGASGAFSSSHLNTIKFTIMQGEIGGLHDDFLHPTSTYLGSIELSNVKITQQPTAAQGHTIAPKGVAGDIVMRDIVWEAVAMSTVSTVPVNTICLCDLGSGLTGTALENTARNIVIDGVAGFVRDEFNTVKDINVLGSFARNPQCQNATINNVNIVCYSTSATEMNIVHCAGGISQTQNAVIDISNTSFHSTNGSGAHNAVRVENAITGGGTISVNIHNNVEPLLAILQTGATCTMTPPQFSGVATVTAAATTVVVTHGLGYTPNIHNINVKPTLLSSSAKWWITAVGATTFTINVDVVPGAGTATFAWKIET